LHGQRQRQPQRIGIERAGARAERDRHRLAVIRQLRAVAFDADALRLSLPLPVQADMQQIKDRVQGWLQGEAKRIFGERLVVYAEKLGVTYSMYALSSA
ncbi:DUF45 domain-containing protein, partial [Burkholderia cenocepacia]